MQTILAVEALDGGGSLRAMGKPKTLLMCAAKLWGMTLDFVIDSGAALEGVVSSSLVPANLPIRQQSAKMVKVGDGRTVWTEGEVNVKVFFWMM